MSEKMEGKLRAMIDIGGLDPEFVLRAGSLEAPKKWETLIHLVAEEAYDSAETGYNTDPLANDLDMLCCSALIYKIYKSLTNVYGSYAAYVF